MNPPKERSRIQYAKPISVNRPVPSNPDTHSGLILSKFEREMSEILISNVLLDIFQGPGFESYVRELTKRQAPLYEDYKMCEESRKQDTGEDCSQELPPQVTEEILEAVVYNLFQELSGNFDDPETTEEWYQLTPIQPKALVNVSEYKDRLAKS